MTMQASLILALLLAFFWSGGHAEPASTFHFEKTILFEAVEADDIVAVPLDSEVYAVVRDQFPDLRVTREDGAETPFLLERATETREETTREIVPFETVSLKEEESHVDIHVQIRDGAPSPGGFTINTKVKDFQRSVDVTGSADGGQWQPLVNGALIFDYSRYLDLKNWEVQLPANQFRHFKITVKEVSKEQEGALKEVTKRFQTGNEIERIEKTQLERQTLRIERLELWHLSRQHRSSGNRESSYPIAGFKTEENPESRQTIVEVQVKREPLTSFRVETTSRNFSRRVEVQAPSSTGTSTKWDTAGIATLYKLDLISADRKQLQISFPEIRGERFRIVIDNHDNPTISIGSIKAAGNVYRAVFVASKGSKYRLRYGSESAPQPDYDVAAVLAHLKSGYQVKEASLGQEVVLSTPPPAPAFTFQKLLNNPILMGTLVGILVLAFGFLLFRAARRVESLPDE